MFAVYVMYKHNKRWKTDMASMYKRKNNTIRVAFDAITGKEWRDLKSELNLSHGNMAKLLIARSAIFDELSDMVPLNETTISLDTNISTLAEPMSCEYIQIFKWRCNTV